MAGNQRFRLRPATAWLIVGLGALGIAALALTMQPKGPIDGPFTSPAASARDVSVGERRAFADALAAVIAAPDESGPTASDPAAWLPDDARASVYVALRSGGERLAEAWFDADTPQAALTGAVREAAGSLEPVERADVDVVEVDVAGRDVTEQDVDGAIGDNVDRGILGVRVELASGDVIRVSPTRMIASNTSFERVVEQAREDGHEPSRAVLFEATQLLVDLEERDVHQLVRGSEVVAPASVTEEGVESLATGMGDWLFAQLGDDGRQVYQYYPSRGEETSANNMIRQWMATVAMTRVGVERGDDTLLERVGQNIEYNLSLSYSEEDGLGLIADADGDVKLGSVALAALAIRQHPARDRWQAEEAALLRMVDELWQPDGSFRTFFRPAGRTDNQNFYPGEALLLWATVLEDAPADEELLERFMASFRHYRDWHRANRNPAFVPWHTMAYEKVWRLTEDPELLDFIVEMNDWLLPMQQWDSAPVPDLAGRFYNPDRPDYGPPHASSDGVYLEGLIAAYRATRDAGDEDRAERYRVTIARGLRNLMQLQFADPVDMFYVSQRERVAGGLRTTPYDNRIRVDNVQHGLMAVLDILDEFRPEDYRTGER